MKLKPRICKPRPSSTNPQNLVIFRCHAVERTILTSCQPTQLFLVKKSGSTWRLLFLKLDISLLKYYEKAGGCGPMLAFCTKMVERCQPGPDNVSNHCRSVMPSTSVALWPGAQAAPGLLLLSLGPHCLHIRAPYFSLKSRSGIVTATDMTNSLINYWAMRKTPHLPSLSFRFLKPDLVIRICFGPNYMRGGIIIVCFPSFTVWEQFNWSVSTKIIKKQLAGESLERSSGNVSCSHPAGQHVSPAGTRHLSSKKKRQLSVNWASSSVMHCCPYSHSQATVVIRAAPSLVHRICFGWAVSSQRPSRIRVSRPTWD